mmetsp:Transcript_30006/g.61232  ORF Transcript_30006/g.61232 Transcript_30006/m.61232 type:complete len:293 (-) Transcript_30006:101-979(-)
MTFLFCSSVIPANWSSSSSSSSSPAATTSKPPSTSPAAFALRASFRSFRSRALILFSCLFCLSVLGIMARTSSALSLVLVFPSSCSSLEGFWRLLLEADLPLALLVSSSLPKLSTPPSESDSKSSLLLTSMFFLNPDVDAFSAAEPMLSNRGLLNHRAVLTEADSFGSVWMSGFVIFLSASASPTAMTFSFFLFFFCSRCAACSSGVSGLEWKPSSSSSTSSSSSSDEPSLSLLAVSILAYLFVSLSTPFVPERAISSSSFACSSAFCRWSFFALLAILVPALAIPSFVATR